MNNELDMEFNKLLNFLSKQFGNNMDMQAILFLIGLQELGKGPVKLSKNEKLDVMHIAICTLLEPFGYYEFEGLDQDRWPHWKTNEKLPALKPGQQQQLMKEAIVEYFKKNKLIEKFT